MYYIGMTLHFKKTGRGKIKMKKSDFLKKADWLYTPAFKDLVTVCVVAIGATDTSQSLLFIPALLTS